jgi:hypothetical protein
VARKEKARRLKGRALMKERFELQAARRREEERTLQEKFDGDQGI